MSPTPVERTQALLSRLRQGDTSAWNDLDEKYQWRLRLMVRTRIPKEIRPYYDTDDLCQSALLSAFKEIDSFQYQGPGSFQGWLSSLMLNRLNSRIRALHTIKRSSDQKQDTRESEGVHELASNGPNPANIAQTADLYAKVVTEATEMLGEQAELLARRIIGGETFSELAKSTGMSESGARRLVAQALVSLNHRMRQKLA